MTRLLNQKNDGAYPRKTILLNQKNDVWQYWTTQKCTVQKGVSQKNAHFEHSHDSLVHNVSQSQKNDVLVVHILYIEKISSRTMSNIHNPQLDGTEKDDRYDTITQHYSHRIWSWFSLSMNYRCRCHRRHISWQIATTRLCTDRKRSSDFGAIQHQRWSWRQPFDQRWLWTQNVNVLMPYHSLLGANHRAPTIPIFQSGHYVVAASRKMNSYSDPGIFVSLCPIIGTTTEYCG